MSKNKYYAVAKGRKPGIYQEWYGADGAEQQVSGFRGARYQGFPTLEEAEMWLRSVSGGGETISSLNMAQAVKDKIAKPKQEAGPQAVDTTNTIIIYTDGGCIGNPGPGGYGAVIKNQGTRQELSGGYRLTTNNRMELMACIVALQALQEPSSVILYSDSQYVVNGISLGWARSWRANGWRRSSKGRAENPDLWEQLLDLCDKHKVEFRWVRGHMGNSENERCDRLSMQAAQGYHLAIDSIYEDNKI